MKTGFKLSIMILAIVLVVACVIAVIELTHMSGIALNLSRQKTMYMARQYAKECNDKIDGYIKVLQALSNIMNFYENLEPDMRRQTYEKTMQSVFEDMPDFVRMFTVWKPDAIDGMDNRYIGMIGSTDKGQFAFTLTRETGQIEEQTSDIVQDAMSHLTGPNNKAVDITDPTTINLRGKDTYCLRIMFPILNKRLNESVAVIGCQINIDMIQTLVEQTIKNYDEVSSMAFYTDTGFILANYPPNLIGKQLVDVETKYGNYLNEVAEAVKNAKEYECSSYDPEMKTNMNMSIAPIPLAASTATWAVMVGSTEKYILSEVNQLKRLIIIFLSIAILAALVIIYLALNRASNQRQRRNNRAAR